MTRMQRDCQYFTGQRPTYVPCGGKACRLTVLGEHHCDRGRRLGFVGKGNGYFVHYPTIIYFCFGTD